MFHEVVVLTWHQLREKQRERGSAGPVGNQLQRRVAPADSMIIGTETPERPRD